MSFADLTPEKLINAVEKATGRPMTGLTAPLPSYINRVYELQTKDGERLIAKFYRPGRWSRETLRDEHDFVLDCAAAEIPVIRPLELMNGDTIEEVDGIYFAVFNKMFGRALEINEAEDWRRVGRLIARLHMVGAQKTAKTRIRLHPQHSTLQDVSFLLEGGFVAKNCRGAFQDICSRIVEISLPLFDDIESLRLHGDCHHGNLLFRPGEGIMVIDFDDMLNGPAVQDLWLLLPDHVQHSGREIELLLEGYRLFRDFDRRTLRMIEPLRAMRIIYFLAWCARQSRDYQFRSHFPDWGTEGFWRKEIADLGRQYRHILETAADVNNRFTISDGADKVAFE